MADRRNRFEPAQTAAALNSELMQNQRTFLAEKGSPERPWFTASGERCGCVYRLRRQADRRYSRIHGCGKMEGR